MTTSTAVSFAALLGDLVASAKGARGAVFCGHDGEFVDLLVAQPQPAGCGELSDYDLKVIGAHLAAPWLRLQDGSANGGAGTALVGDPETVAARIREYQDVGIDTFIMSGYPHLEEAYRFAELVFPLLSLQQPNNVTPIRVNTGPFGETIGNEYRPQVKASQS